MTMHADHAGRGGGGRRRWTVVAATTVLAVCAALGGETATSVIAWSDNLSGALTRAHYELKSVLAVFTSQSCPWCVRMKSETLEEKEVQEALKGFVCVILDTGREPKAVQQYQIRGVPVTMIFSGDGLLQTSAEGFMDKAAFLAFLETYRKGGGSGAPASPELGAWLKALQSTNSVPTALWPEIMSGLGINRCRTPLRSALLSRTPAPRSEWVQLLSHPRLAVRLGTCEILETQAGTSFGYDPWSDVASNSEALKRWSGWAASADTNTNEVERVFSSLTEEQIAGYIRDLSASARDRSSRAVRMLEEAGESVVPALDAWLASNPLGDSPSRRQVREVRYFLLLPDSLGSERARIVHWLIFGNQDERLRSLQSIALAGARAVPVLTDFLADADPLIREGAVDGLVDAAKSDAYPYLRDLLQTEKDEEVIHSIVRAAGSMKGEKAVELARPFLGHSNEDLAVAALASLSRTKSAAAVDAVKAALKHTQWRVRAAALEALGKMRAKNAETEVLACLDDADPFVRRTAVMTLSAISAKKSVKRLETIFLKDDALKGPVVAALTGMDAVIPDSFAGALTGKDSDVLLSVLDGLGDGDNESWRLAVPYIRHENNDVSCAAIRLVTKAGGHSREVQRVLAEALRSGVRERMITVFESLSRVESRRPEMDFIRPDDDQLFEKLTAQLNSTDQGSGVTNDVLSEVFLAFEAAAQSTAGTPSPSASQTQDQTSLNDVFAAFGNGVGEGASATTNTENALPAENTESADLTKIALSYLDPKWDDELRFSAALMLIAAGHEAGVKYAAESIVSRTSEEKIKLAKCARACRGDRVVALIEKLLRDPSSDVRRAAVSLCLEDKSGDALIGALIEAAFEPHTVLSPSDVMKEPSDWYQAISRISARKKIGPAIRQVLSNPADPNYGDPARIVALALLAPCWKPEDESLVARYLNHANPFVRRSAWYTFGTRCSTAFYEKVQTVAKDTSEWVRAVLPAVFNQGGDAAWSIYFDAETAVESAHRFSSRSSSRKRLTRPVVDLLTELCKDTSVPVRGAAAMCLLSNHEKVDPNVLKAMLDAASDKSWCAYRISSLIEGTPMALLKELNPRDTVSLIDAVIEETSDREEDKLKQIRARLVSDSENTGSKRQVVLRKELPITPPTQAVQQLQDTPGSQASAASSPAQRRVVFFRNPGCRDCERVSEMLKVLTAELPDLAVEEKNVRKPDDARYNEALCERFGVDSRFHLTAPAVFSGAGFLIKSDITFERLGQLLSRDEALESGWRAVTDSETERAAQNISEQYASMGLWVVFGAGLLDGINPCAFATIIFLLSYLQLTRRGPREILAVGGAFVSGVFLAYFLLGLGAVEIVVRFDVLRRFGLLLNWAMAAFVAGVALLNVWDGIQCMRGRMGDMVLQLPKALKGGIQQVIGTSSRTNHFIVAAFAAGVVVSALELACTGQVYAPTLLYILKTGASRTGAILYLGLYNVAFIVPLLVVFAGAYGGLRSERLIVWLRRHAAWVKFATALLFVALFAAFVFGSLVQK